MTNISDLINALEKLTFQLISWIVLIPKTIFWILAAPSSMVKYIDHQIKSKTPEFQKFISPIFLFLFVGLVPVMLGSILKLPEVHIEGERNVLVDSTYRYKATVDYLSDWTDYRTSEYIYEYVWSYGEERNILQTFLFNNYIPKENVLEVEFYNRDTFDLYLNIYAYQLADYTDFDEKRSTTYSGDNVLADDYAYVSIDTLPFEGSYLVYAFDDKNELKKSQRIMSKDNIAEDIDAKTIDEKRLYALGLTLMLLPLFFAVSLILKERKEINVPNLKSFLYEQCALFSPIILIFQLGVLFENILPPESIGNATYFVLILLLLSLVWFVRSQSKIYELSLKYILGILFVLPFIITLFIMFFIEALIEFSYFRIVIWLFILAIFTPMVMSFFIKKKDFVAEKQTTEVESVEKEN